MTMPHAVRPTLRIWLGSFLIVAVVASCFFGAPLWPVLMAGAATLIVTLMRHYASK